MKPSAPRPFSRGALALWTLSCFVLLAAVLLWVLVALFGDPSAAEVRAEGARVVAVLEEHRSARGRYPARLEDTRVTEMKFRRGLGVGYMPNATLERYILTVSGGAHTWTYDSATGAWELAAPGG